MRKLWCYLFGHGKIIFEKLSDRYKTTCSNCGKEVRAKTNP